MTDEYMTLEKIANGRLLAIESGLASVNSFCDMMTAFVREQKEFNRAAQERSDARDKRIDGSDKILALLEQRLSSGTCMVGPNGCPTVKTIIDTTVDHEARLRTAEKVTQICIDHEDRLRVAEKITKQNEFVEPRIGKAETAVEVLKSRVTLGGVLALTGTSLIIGWMLNNMFALSKAVETVRTAVNVSPVK